MEACPKNRNGYSTHFGGEGFWEGERSLGLGGALHAVAQGAHALLPVACEPSPLDLPHGRIAQVGHVCPDCSDSFETQWTKLGFVPQHGEALLLCQGPNAAGPQAPPKPRKFQMGPWDPSAGYSFACSILKTIKPQKALTVLKNYDVTWSKTDS